METTTIDTEIDNEQEKKNIKSLEYEIRDEWRTEDEEAVSAVILDLGAMLRTGKLTSELKDAKVVLNRSYGGSELTIKFQDGTVVKLSGANQIERGDASEIAIQLYDGGRRAKRERNW